MPEETSSATAPPPFVETALEASWNIPAWAWITFCIGALLFAIWIYATERGHAKPLARAVLVSLRFLLLFLVLWMFAGWSWTRFETDRPNLTFVVDLSASMQTRDVTGADGELQSRIHAIQTSLAELSASTKETLQERYSLLWYGIAEDWTQLPSGFSADSTRWQARGKQSRLGENLTQLIHQRPEENSVFIFLSDGINTAGSSLAEAEKLARAAALPVYTVTLGRDFTLPDLRLGDVLLEKEAYLGDQVTVEATISSNDLAEHRSTVALIDVDSGKTLDQVDVVFPGNLSQQSTTLVFTPERAGLARLQVKVAPIEGETDLSNNLEEVQISVQNKVIRVLLVSEKPSYEFRFLKHFLERSQLAGDKSKNFEVASVLQESDAAYVLQDSSALRLVPSNREELEDTDVFIFGELDPSLISRRAQQIIYEIVTDKGAGCLFIWGARASAQDLEGWPLGDLLPIRTDITIKPDSATTSASWHWLPTAVGESTLPLLLESSSAANQKIWQRLPPIVQVASGIKLKPAAQTLATAANDDDSSQTLPLLVAQFAGAGRTVLQLTDETYRWTSFEGSDTYHQRYWGQLLRWTARGKLGDQSEESELRTEPPQIQFGQSMRISASIGTALALEELPALARVTLVDDQEVQRIVSLTQSSRDQRSYSAEFDDLQPSNYRALLVQPTVDPPPTAEFTVSAPPGEQVDLRADVEAMQSLASATRGKAYRSDQFAKLFDELPTGNRNRLGTLPSIPLWNAWWVATLFVLLITAEWLLRRQYRML